MSKKRMNREEQIEDVQAKLAEARAKRLKNAEEAGIKVEQADLKPEFLAFWAQERANYSKERDFAEILWLHLKATGHDKPEKFLAGIEHFGLKKSKQSLG